VATDRHTRVVGWLKVLLPLLALAVLSTLFLLADRIDPDDALPYAEVDVEDLAREPRMTSPTYAGTTADGAAVTLSAVEARQALGGSPAAALALRFRLDTPEGGHAELTAAGAELDADRREVVLSGGVTITTSSGYRVSTDSIAARLDRTGLETRAAVTATGPAGDLSAAAMQLRQDIQTPGSYLIVFNGGVRLVYLPGG
jgi:lipopolysaccharide export system protein LptC